MIKRLLRWLLYGLRDWCKRRAFMLEYSFGPQIEEYNYRRANRGKK